MTIKFDLNYYYDNIIAAGYYPRTTKIAAIITNAIIVKVVVDLTCNLNSNKSVER